MKVTSFAPFVARGGFSLFFLATTWLVVVASLLSPLVDETYSFDQFLLDFGRQYPVPAEYAQRKAIFEKNLATIVHHNNRNQHSYQLGINPFADQRPEELFTGYDILQSSRVTTAATATHRRMSRKKEPTLPFRVDPISELPKAVDWRAHGVTTPVKSQGGCGSCWSFAATTVLESHIALQTGVLFDLSPQEIVSCAPNPQHCGGEGGCTGSTAELAFELVRQHGIVQEWDFGYQDYHGEHINCTLSLDLKASTTSTVQSQQGPRHLRHSSKDTNDDGDKHFYHGAVATIADYAVLPSNNYTVLMNAVAKLGPVAVAVACLPWHLYQSGVFYAPLNSSTAATDLNHLVVLEGYGTDQETGEDYWLVRNSWGPLWGEGGYIRLKRVGDHECGLNIKPADGTACTIDDKGNPVTPPPETICGNSGILFDSVLPVGGHLIRKHAYEETAT
jgi:cathepsin L